MRVRNRCIDTIKGVACIAVAFIHFNWGGDTSRLGIALFRFAVPFFFFVSGFYLPDGQKQITAANLRRKIRHLLHIALVCAVVYSIACIGECLLINGSWDMMAYIREHITSWNIANFFISANPFVYGHFWYLLSLLYCYVIIYAVGRNVGGKVYLTASLLLLCVYTLLAEFHDVIGISNHLTVGNGNVLTLSNIFVLRSMPFFLWGIWLKMSGWEKLRRPSLWGLLGMAAAGFVLTAFESRWAGNTLMYVGTHITVFALSGMALWYPEKRLPLLEYIGDKLSMYVYLYHVAVGRIWDVIAAKGGFRRTETYLLLRPALIIGGTLLTAQMIVWLKKRNMKKVTA